MIILLGFSILVLLISILFFVFTSIARRILCNGDLGYSVLHSKLNNLDVFIPSNGSLYTLCVKNKTEIYLSENNGKTETPLFYFPTTKKRFKHYFDLYQKDFRA